MNQQDTNNQSIIEDLTAQNDDAIKGGGGAKSSAVVSLGKLGRVENQPEPAANHNETTVNDEADDVEDAADTAPVADLAVTEEQAEQAKGGAQVNIRWERLRVP